MWPALASLFNNFSNTGIMGFSNSIWDTMGDMVNRSMMNFLDNAQSGMVGQTKLNENMPLYGAQRDKDLQVNSDLARLQNALDISRDWVNVDTTNAKALYQNQLDINKQMNQQDFDWKMGTTENQRKVADLEAAGINPMFAYGGSSQGGAVSGGAITSDNSTPPNSTAHSARTGSNPRGLMMKFIKLFGSKQGQTFLSLAKKVKESLG